MPAGEQCCLGLAQGGSCSSASCVEHAQSVLFKQPSWATAPAVRQSCCADHACLRNHLRYEANPFQFIYTEGKDYFASSMFAGDFSSNVTTQQLRRRVAGDPLDEQNRSTAKVWFSGGHGQMGKGHRGEAAGLGTRVGGYAISKPWGPGLQQPAMTGSSSGRWLCATVAFVPKLQGRYTYSVWIAAQRRA